MRAVLALAVLLAALVAATPAQAAPSTLERGRGEVDQARVLVGEALVAAKAGDRERAYRIARSAYLDHFEYVEIPLRLRNPNLVLDTEFKFAQLRNDIRDGAPLPALRRDTADVREGLLAVDRELAAKGVAAPLVAFGFSFSILFREGDRGRAAARDPARLARGGQRRELQAAARLGRRRRGRCARCCCSRSPRS